MGVGVGDRAGQDKRQTGVLNDGRQLTCRRAGLGQRGQVRYTAGGCKLCLCVSGCRLEASRISFDTRDGRERCLIRGGDESPMEGAQMWMCSLHGWREGWMDEWIDRWTAACATEQDVVSFHSIRSTAPEQSHRSQRQGKQSSDQRHSDTVHAYTGAATITHLITSVTQRQPARRTQRPSWWHPPLQDVSLIDRHPRTRRPPSPPPLASLHPTFHAPRYRPHGSSSHRGRSAPAFVPPRRPKEYLAARWRRRRCLGPSQIGHRSRTGKSVVR